MRWLNDYLDSAASAEEQAELLTRAGFPLEEREDVQVSDGPDVRQDYEMTSNRGDAVCHTGLAREIAAISGRTLKLPQPDPQASGPPASDIITVTNHEPKRCPLYTGRVMRGVKVQRSPQWLADRLLARGDIPRNNVVDATNFVLFELGQPTHVFDLAKLKGSQINIRMAYPGEPFLPIGEGESEVKLSVEDLVIADAEDAVAIGGVKGGALTAVTDATTDLVLEAASFDPVSIRNSSRRLNIASDASYRFERGVHPGQVHHAADRLAELILELAGGELCEGVVEDGAPIPAPRIASMRPDRCRKILGVDVTDDQMLAFLSALGFEPRMSGDRVECTVPVQRLDIEREIDLIEEVGRMFGHDRIPIAETIQVRVAPPQPTELAKQAVAGELVGMGFVETVTHSLVGEEVAAPFLPEGAHFLRVDDERAGAEPVLQPSVIPTLLRVRRVNHDNGVDHLRLFESASIFWGTEEDHEEIVTLGLLMDVDDPQDGLRPMRGIIQRLAEILLGHDVHVDVEADEKTKWLAPGAKAIINGEPVGRFGLLSETVAKRSGLDQSPLVAELNLLKYYESYPPETEAHALPSFPAIARDLSLLIDENVTWAQITRQVDGLKLDYLQATEFITTFRGKQVGPGKKSLSFRLRFRAPDRTLKHEEVDPQIDAVVKAMEQTLHAEIRK
ncbi:MAG: phenylalanine--tRNA ligase subunit beta [Phycisphaerales bacterium]|nr:MAG: phenylalanine--tRNA ligase subunit beta [Phycisphaerales bacterium]